MLFNETDLSSGKTNLMATWVGNVGDDVDEKMKRKKENFIRQTVSFNHFVFMEKRFGILLSFCVKAHWHWLVAHNEEIKIIEWQTNSGKADFHYIERILCFVSCKKHVFRPSGAFSKLFYVCHCPNKVIAIAMDIRCVSSLGWTTISYFVAQFLIECVHRVHTIERQKHLDLVNEEWLHRRRVKYNLILFHLSQFHLYLSSAIGFNIT